jgi:hypothetical protein
MRKICFFMFFGLFPLLLAIGPWGPAQAQTEEPQAAAGRQFDRMQFTGVIKNQTRYDVYFPSDNSGGTILVPASGSAEFIIWSPTYELIGYVNGQQVYCEKVQVVPDNFKFRCKTYDFVAEITAPPCRPKAYKFKKKRRHAPRKPQGPEVEGLG